MNITIIGSGSVGRALGNGWRKAGHSVTFGVRDPAGKAAELKQQGFTVVEVGAAARAADVVVLAVPWSAVAATIKALGALTAKIVVDATNPLTASLELALGFNDSAGETWRGSAPARASSRRSTPPAPTTWRTAAIRKPS